MEELKIIFDKLRGAGRGGGAKAAGRRGFTRQRKQGAVHMSDGAHTSARPAQIQSGEEVQSLPYNYRGGSGGLQPESAKGRNTTCCSRASTSCSHSLLALGGGAERKDASEFHATSVHLLVFVIVSGSRYVLIPVLMKSVHTVLIHIFATPRFCCSMSSFCKVVVSCTMHVFSAAE